MHVYMYIYIYIYTYICTHAYRGPAGLRDHDVGVVELAVELGVRPVLGNNDIYICIYREREREIVSISNNVLYLVDI